jgi:hypothetical protein
VATEVVGRLEHIFKPSSQPVPIALIRLRVMTEGLQFPDPTDPALAKWRPAGGKGEPMRLSITLRMALGRSTVANDVVHRIEVPPFEPGGAFVPLDRVLYDGIVQSGEALVVEVVSGETERGPVEAEQLRFKDTLSGDPSDWVGAHPPSRSQPWRLWYRIETAPQE